MSTNAGMNVENTVPCVAIILVNWNGWRDSVECIDSILACDYPDYHIYLVDNNSTDYSVEHILDWCDRPSRFLESRDFEGVGHYSNVGEKIRYRLLESLHYTLSDSVLDCRLTIIRSGGNLGFAGGNNVGIRVAGLDHYDYFWLLNTDTVIRTDALAQLVERANKDDSLGIVGSTLLYYYEPKLVQAMGGATLDTTHMISEHIGINSLVSEVPADGQQAEAKMAYVVGASMLVSRSFIRDVGYMQEDYFLYFEEIDWAMRGHGKYRMGYAPRSVVYHKVGASSSQVASMFSLRLLYRNRIRFVSRFLPDRLGATKRYMVLELVRHVLKGRWIAARAMMSALIDAPKLEASFMVSAGMGNYRDRSDDDPS